jgi:Protein of unknown function (DUF3224)
MKNLTNCLMFGLCALADGQAQTPVPNATGKGKAMMKHAGGTFEVKLHPLRWDDKEQGKILGRMSIDKRFHGELEATSKGQMLTAGTVAKGSAGYVAIEQVDGSLQGKKGTFILQHSGTMTRGVPQLSVTVVPDSGTGELAGLAGKMTIKIEEGKHFYEFEYTLSEGP